MGVVKGTILSEASFLPQGSAEELMAKIPPGMRAFTVSLRSGYPDLTLLRPGSIVDIVSITKLDRNRGGQSIASPLLNGILVLAVQGESMISNPSSEQKGTATQRSSAGGVQVTLQVDSHQAGALQLAISQGSIALVLRNPRDKMTPSMDPIMLDDGGRYIPVRPEDLLRTEEQNAGVSSPVMDPNKSKNGVAPFVPAAAGSPKNNPAPQNQRRKVIIHRGNKTEEETLEESKSEDSTTGKTSSIDSERRIDEVR
jgi:Flp pilus assembly protein CpaB